jgi:hypothetical protein
VLISHVPALYDAGLKLNPTQFLDHQLPQVWKLCILNWTDHNIKILHIPLFILQDETTTLYSDALQNVIDIKFSEIKKRITKWKKILTEKFTTKSIIKILYLNTTTGLNFPLLNPSTIENLYSIPLQNKGCFQN